MSNWFNRIAGALEKGVRPVVGVASRIGAAVLAAMMFLTAVDVFLRYVFNRPIPGSYELTEFMMAILVFFALAYTQIHKGHVFVELVIDRFSTGLKAVINTAIYIISLALFAYMSWQLFVQTKAQHAGGLASASLLIPVYPFIFLAVLGVIFLSLVLLCDLLRFVAKALESRDWRMGLWLAIAAIIAIGISVFPFWRPFIPPPQSPLSVGFIGVGLLIVLLFSGMPIGFVMALIGFIGMTYIAGPGAGLGLFQITPYVTSASYSLSVLPLFILMGEFCFQSGLSKDLYYAVYRWLGHLPGGLAMATVGGCALFAAVSGSSMATAATLGTVALPEMRRYRYDERLATGAVASGGTLGILIPPSVIFILYGILTEQSIGQLFMAGFLPGVLLAGLFMVTIYLQCRRNIVLGPPGGHSTLRERLDSLWRTWIVAVLFVLVIGGIYAGVFTPTEAAGIGAAGSFLFAIGRRTLSWKGFSASLVETAKTTGMVFAILIGAMVFGFFLGPTRLPQALSDFVAGLPVPTWVIFTIVVIVYIFLGCIMDSLAMVLLTIPIIYPMIMALGFDPIWFGVIIVIVVEMGMITPPVGLNVFVISGIAKGVPMYSIFRGIVPFIGAMIACIVILYFAPQIALFLPRLLYK